MREGEDVLRFCSRASRSCRVALVLLLAAFSFGCETLENHKCCLFSEEGIFAKRRSTVDNASKKEEQDAIARASLGSSNRKEAWEPTEEELKNAQNAGINLKEYVWSTQRPNGGALFPKKWNGPGPALVVEPGEIAAPVGTEVIVVASYIGEDSQYLRVGEKLSWDISGTGIFLESNPSDGFTPKIFTGEYEGCLNCPLIKNARKAKEDSKTLTTTTSDQLWRINRGTETRLDDVTILRGQSWTSVSSTEEGTTSVSVMSDTIGNWDKRRATAQIHWVDAAFKFPQSGLAMVNTSTTLSTSVVRRSTSEPRDGWTVRYDVLSGDAGLGPNKLNSLAVTTDASGNADVALSQLRGTAGTAKIKATVLRPATDRYRQVEVDSRVFFYTWTYVAPVTLSIRAPQQFVQGQPVTYQLVVMNLSDFAQYTSVELVLPPGTTLTEPTTKWVKEASDKSWIRWEINGLPPRGSYVIDVTTLRESGTPQELNARIVESNPIPEALDPSPTSAPSSSSAAPSDSSPSGSSAAPSTNPPVTSPTSAPSSSSATPSGSSPSGSSTAPSTNPPVTSPTSPS